MRNVQVSVVMPCLNEVETLAACILEAQQAFASAGIHGEVIIADNGSIDGSQETARQHGARVVDVAEIGYGAALSGGIQVAMGEFIVMGDADGSYDFGYVPQFLEKLREGYDLVIGNRFSGGIERGAMLWHHKYLGNPALSGLGRWLFGVPVKDFHCGLRAFSKGAFQKLMLTATGMEFASEMVAKSAMNGLRISELPTVLRPDGRTRPPHLRSFRDGWRHLHLMLRLYVQGSASVRDSSHDPFLS